MIIKCKMHTDDDLFVTLLGVRAYARKRHIATYASSGITFATNTNNFGQLCQFDWRLKERMTKAKSRRWSQKVTEKSNALDLEEGVFSLEDPRSIARSLKRSADRSRRRKADPFRSAMSMLTFYINRAGKRLSKSRRERLDAAKDELRDLYGKR